MGVAADGWRLDARGPGGRFAEEIRNFRSLGGRRISEDFRKLCESGTDTLIFEIFENSIDSLRFSDRAHDLFRQS